MLSLLFSFLPPLRPLHHAVFALFILTAMATALSCCLCSFHTDRVCDPFIMLSLSVLSWPQLRPLYHTVFALFIPTVIATALIRCSCSCHTDRHNNRLTLTKLLFSFRPARRPPYNAAIDHLIRPLLQPPHHVELANFIPTEIAIALPEIVYFIPTAIATALPAVAHFIATPMRPPYHRAYRLFHSDR